MAVSFAKPALPIPIPVPLWQRLVLAACMFLITGTFGFIQTFVPLYLEAAGLHRDEYGRVIALGTFLALLVQPIVGRLSDRYDARRPFMVAGAVLAGLSYFAYRYANGFWAFTFLTALGANGFQYLNAAPGVLIGRMATRDRAAGIAQAGGGAAYTKYRVWGSVGYIVVALVTGVLVGSHLPKGAALDRVALAGVFTYGPLLYVGIGLLSLFVPDGRAPVSKTETETAEGRAEDVATERARQANLHRFLVAFFGYQFALYGAAAYLPQYMKDLGASPPWITGMFAAGVSCEILVMTRVGKWTDQYGRRPALALALLLVPIRLLLYLAVARPWWVILVQTLHGFNFGIAGTIALVFVNDLTGDLRRGAAQARLAMVQGMGVALGPLLCGFLAQRLGIPWMFVAMATVALMAAMYFLLFVEESHPAPQTPEAIAHLPAPVRAVWMLLTQPPRMTKTKN